jgi:hypothetical protein
MTLLLALAVGALLFAATALVSTAFVQYSRNTLARNGRWISAKSGMQMSLMGADHFMHTRNALYRDSLNLHAWHGHNEVDLNEVFEPQSIELRFRLADAAHLEVLFNRDESGYDGLRLSRSGQFPSTLFHADRRGSFTARRALDVDTAALVGDGWHRLELRLGEERLQGRIDSRLVIDAPVRRLQRQFIGLRGGSEPAVVDWVRVREAGGRTVIDESFSNSRGTTAVLLGAGAVYFTVYAILAWFMLRHGKHGVALTTAVALGVPLAFFLVFERRFLVSLPKGPLEAIFGF